MAERDRTALLLAGLGLALLALSQREPRFPPPPPEGGIEIDELLRTIEQLRAELEKLKRQFGDLKALLADALRLLENLGNEIAELERIVSDLEAKRNKLLKDIDEAQRIVDNLEQVVLPGLDDELRRLQEATGLTDEQLRTVRSHVATLREELHVLQNKLKDLENTAKSMEREIEDLRTVINDLTNIKNELQAKLTQAQQKIAEMESTIKNLESQIATLEDQINRLKLVLDWLNAEIRMRDQVFPAISSHLQGAYQSSFYYMPPHGLSRADGWKEARGAWIDRTIDLTSGLSSNIPYTCTFEFVESDLKGTLQCNHWYGCCDGWPCPRCHSDSIKFEVWLELLDSSGQVIRRSEVLTASAGAVHPALDQYYSYEAKIAKGSRLNIEIPKGGGFSLRLRAKTSGWAQNVHTTSIDKIAINLINGALFYGSELGFRGSTLSDLEAKAAGVSGALMRVQDAPQHPGLTAMGRVAKVEAVNGIQATLFILPYSQEVPIRWWGRGDSVPNGWPYGGWFLFGTDGSGILIYAHADRAFPSEAPDWSGNATVKLPSGAYILVAFAGQCAGGASCAGVGSRVGVEAQYGFYNGIRE